MERRLARPSTAMSAWTSAIFLDRSALPSGRLPRCVCVLGLGWLIPTLTPAQFADPIAAPPMRTAEEMQRRGVELAAEFGLHVPAGQGRTQRPAAAAPAAPTCAFLFSQYHCCVDLFQRSHVEIVLQAASRMPTGGLLVNPGRFDASTAVEPQRPVVMTPMQLREQSGLFERLPERGASGRILI